MIIRPGDEKDLKFLKEMLFEAVYWRSKIKPNFEESMKLEGIREAVEDFGKEGDLALIAEETEPLGAVWIRYYDSEHPIRGFISEAIPVLVIAIKEEARKKGLGLKLLRELLDIVDYPISLCVSKDNYALSLYEKSGFTIYEDIGDSYIMISKKQ